MERLGDGARRALAAVAPATTGEITDIAAAWPAAVGPAIAAAAWPNRIGRDGTLHVATVSSVWAFELGRMQSALLAQLRSRVSTLSVSALRFAVGPVPEPSGTAESPPPAGPRPTTSDRAFAAEVAAAIGDDELRDTVARAAAASLAGTRSDRRFW
jgi:hypothetical protein